MRRSVDVESLAAGIAVIAVGTIMLLDQSGSIELTATLVGALNAAMIGVILLAGGLGRDRDTGADEEEDRPER
ncbi:MAG TPA: hypothetical protein VIL04_12270 [Solirubrobacterales bacterium]